MVIDFDGKFYVCFEDDPLVLSNEIADVFRQYGLDAEQVLNPQSIPKKKSPETGTGFFISPSVIVTNEHVVNDETDIVYYINGNPHNATPLFVDKSTDLAFLRAEIKVLGKKLGHRVYSH